MTSTDIFKEIENEQKIVIPFGRYEGTLKSISVYQDKYNFDENDVPYDKVLISFRIDKGDYAGKYLNMPVVLKSAVKANILRRALHQLAPALTLTFSMYGDSLPNMINAFKEASVGKKYCINYYQQVSDKGFTFKNYDIEPVLEDINTDTEVKETLV